MNEAFIMGVLKHPNIVKLYASGWLNNSIKQLCLEYMNSDNLLKYLRKSNVRLNMLEIALQISEGCKYLEENNIIHRFILH